MAPRALRAIALALLAVTAIGACGKSPPPEGYRSGEEEIAQAKNFQASAERCYRDSRNGKACAEAVALYERQAAAPVHFATKAEWAEFSDLYFGGIHLLMKVSLNEMCAAPATSMASSMCAAREAAINERAEAQQQRPGTCSVSMPHWPKSVGPFPPDGEPSYAQLRLLADGTMEWNASQLEIDGDWRRVDRTELRQLLRVMDDMPMEPHLVVDVAPAAKCEAIKDLSNDLHTLAMCKAGRCLERSAWENYGAE